MKSEPDLPSVAYSARTAPNRRPTPFDVPLPARLKYSVGLPRTSFEEPAQSENARCRHV